MQYCETIFPLLLLAVGLFELRSRCYAATGELTLAPGLRLKIRQLVLRLSGFGPDLMQTGLELLDCGTCGINFSFGFCERQLVGGWIETEQHVAGGNGRMILDAHLGDTAGNFTRDLGDICLDEGVLGRDVAAALQPREQRSRQHQHGHADQRQLLLPPGHDAILGAGLIRGAAFPLCRPFAA